MTALAKIHVAKKQLGMDDDTYRDVLDRTVGQRTAKGLSEAQCGKVLEEFNRLGFKPSSGGRRKALEGHFAKKLQALWIAGWNLGIVKNRDDHALLAFVKRQTDVDHTRFLHHPEDAAKVIEALKGWLARDGGVDWGTDGITPDWYRAPGARIADAQLRILVRLGAMAKDQTLRAYTIEQTGIHVEAMTDSDWQPVMNDLGRRIRARKAA